MWLPELHLVAIDLRGHGQSHLRSTDSEQYPAISLVTVPSGHNMIGTHPHHVARLIRHMVEQVAANA